MNDEKPVHAGGACLRAIDLMHRSGVAPLPRNYELFYVYASGKNEALEQALEAELDHGGEIPQTELDRLYESHIADQKFSGDYAVMGNRLSRQIGTASQLIQDAITSNSQYGSALNQANSRLAHAADHAADLNDVKALLADIVAATAQMGSASHQFADRLAATSAKVETLQNEVDKLRRDFQVDPLTGIGNRRRFDTALSAETARAERCDQPLCLLMIDVDNFKRFNDTFGHRMGDSALRLVARLLKDTVREHDTVARYGGEEFAAILANCDLPNAAELAERFRTALGSMEIVRRSTGEKFGHIYASIGIAQLRAGDTEEALIERADRALYDAKEAGRNQVALEVADEDETDRLSLPAHAPEAASLPDHDGLMFKTA